MELAAIENILGGKKILRRKIENPVDLLELSKAGLTKEALVHVAKFLRIPMHQMAKLLPITERTIQRYGATRHFSRVVSEQVIRIAEVAARGIEVFGDRDKFLDWINQPNRALADEEPVNLLGSIFGTEMVLDELGRIEHGAFS